MDKNKEIGLKIEGARKEKGMSLQDVANIVSVARSTIQRYEQGTIKTVKLPVVEAIANALGVNPAWVIGKSKDKYGNTLPLPHAESRQVLSEGGMRLYLDADSRGQRFDPAYLHQKKPCNLNGYRVFSCLKLCCR